MNSPMYRHYRQRPRITPVVAALAVVLITLTVSGCSVFGVAKKSELEALEQANEQQRAQVVRQVENLRSELDTVSAEIGALEQSLEPRLAAMENDVAAANAEVDELELMVEGVRLSTARVSRDMETTVTAAHHARLRSQETWDEYFNALLDERAHLQLRLDALSEKIERLQASEGQRQTTQETPVPENRIEPEKVETAADEIEATASSNR